MKEIINEVAKAISEHLKEDIMSIMKRELEKFQTIETEKLLTIQEASKIYKVHSNTIRNWVLKKELETYRIGGKIYVKYKNI